MNRLQLQIGQDPHRVPETDLPEKALGFRVQLYGMTQHRDLFTQRQLTALTTFSDLANEAARTGGSGCFQNRSQGGRELCRWRGDIFGI